MPSNVASARWIAASSTSSSVATAIAASAFRTLCSPGRFSVTASGSSARARDREARPPAPCARVRSRAGPRHRRARSGSWAGRLAAAARDDRVIAAQHREPVERQVVQELDEALLQLLEIPAMRDEVVVVDIGDDRDDRLQVQERGVALVGFSDEISPGAELRVAPGALEPAADHECRIEAALGEHRGDEARRRRLAMRAGDRDALAETHQLGQHFGARDDRHAHRLRGGQFRIVGGDRARDDDDVGALDLPCRMTDEDAHAHLRESRGDRICAQVRALHLVAEIDQDLGDAAHAGAADADRSG